MPKCMPSLPEQAVDVVEFLWASLALFDDDTAAADTATVYQARPFELYAVAEARERILQLLAEAPEGASLERFLPDPLDIPERGARGTLWRRSAWSSTFIAGLELAKQGTVVLGQGEDFEPIHVALALVRGPDRRGLSLRDLSYWEAGCARCPCRNRRGR
jgi:segregation and condensation protein A